MSPMTHADPTMVDATSAPPGHPADRLLAAIDRVGAPACVGIDPVLERLPDESRGKGDPVAAIEHFCSGVLEAIAPSIAVCKFQSACFERHGAEGFALLQDLLGRARSAGLHVILDAKRGDIGISAEHYAAAARGRADWVTVNPYLGVDGIEPFIADGSLGAFALVRTSNPGGDAIQSLQLGDGRQCSDAVATLVAEAGAASIGACGYSALGAVVGATKREDAGRLRALMPEQIFLVPGYGAQGGGVADVLPCFDDSGRGAIVTASRSVLYAFEGDDGAWQSSVQAAAERFATELADGIRST